MTGDTWACQRRCTPAPVALPRLMVDCTVHRAAPVILLLDGGISDRKQITTTSVLLYRNTVCKPHQYCDPRYHGHCRRRSLAAGPCWRFVVPCSSMLVIERVLMLHTPLASLDTTLFTPPVGCPSALQCMRAKLGDLRIACVPAVRSVWTTGKLRATVAAVRINSSQQDRRRTRTTGPAHLRPPSIAALR